MSETQKDLEKPTEDQDPGFVPRVVFTLFMLFVVPTLVAANNLGCFGENKKTDDTSIINQKKDGQAIDFSKIESQ